MEGFEIAWWASKCESSGLVKKGIGAGGIVVIYPSRGVVDGDQEGPTIFGKSARISARGQQSSRIQTIAGIRIR